MNERVVGILNLNAYIFYIWNMTTPGIDCIIFCLFVTKVEELDIPEDPCNSSQDYNFYACVRAAVSSQV